MLAIIDYSAGNLKSVVNALDYIGCPTVTVSDPSELLKADRAILPGVGAFGDAAEKLKASGMDEASKEFIKSGKPFLGICLGLQLLFDESEESSGTAGLSLLKGDISRFPDMGLKIPHIGWNSLEIKKPDGIFKGIDDGSYFYFVHSYCLHAHDRKDAAAVCEYGIPFDAAVEKDNLAAVQFHPEKSGEIGLQLLRNFISL